VSEGCWCCGGPLDEEGDCEGGCCSGAGCDFCSRAGDDICCQCCEGEIVDEGDL
jgi:hypothetical protein